MIIIGELINGMYKAVGRAIKNKDKTTIQKIAKDQAKAGAAMLDINAGPASSEPVADMRWLVETVQEVVDLPLVLDSTKPKAIEEALKIVNGRALINSTNADDEKLKIFLPMAKKYNAQIIGLTMDKKGVPRDRNERSELALKIVSACAEHGFPIEDLFIDPVVLPVNVAQAQSIEVLESIKELKLLSDPAPKTVVGLSNVSQGAKNRGLINRTYLIMAAGFGLSAAIVNPLDRGLMDGVITAELLLNENIYCDSYLRHIKRSG